MIIDVHVHIYPDKIAKKASDTIGEFYEIDMCYDGSLTQLIEDGKMGGVDKFVIHSAATAPRQVESINDFIYATYAAHPDVFIPLGTMHVDYENIEQEIRRIRDLGFKGIKIHPEFQKFEADCEAAYRIYEVLERLGMILLIHAGDRRYHLSSPARIANIIRDFPSLKVLAAHFGGYSEWENIERDLKPSDNLFVDTSSSFFMLSDEQIMELIRYFGVEHTMFGTDYPMWNARDEIARINALELNEKEKRMIFSDNAIRFFGL